MDDNERAKRDDAIRQRTIMEARTAETLMKRLDKLPLAAWKTANRYGEGYGEHDLATKIDGFDIYLTRYTLGVASRISVRSEGLEVWHYGQGGIDELYDRISSRMKQCEEEQERIKEEAESGKRGKLKVKFLKFLGA